MSIKLLLTLPGVGFLAGCVWVNQNYYAHTSESSVVNRYEPQHVSIESTPPAVVVESTHHKTTVGCAPFTPPPQVALPEVPSFTVPEVPIEEQLAVYMLELRQVIESEREALSHAVDEHRKTCTE